jgi:hypothetical protein
MHQNAQHPHFFGYGSLVNRATHDHDGGQIITVRGWRRLWARAPGRDVAFLTVRPDPDGQITGLAAPVAAGDWTALDLREAAYTRIPIPTSDILQGPALDDLAIYAVPQADLGPASKDAPVLLSYIDVVFQGYLRETGPKGLAEFIRSTDHWDAPIKNDRAAPIYPRAQTITAAERDLIDASLRDLGAAVF